MLEVGGTRVAWLAVLLCGCLVDSNAPCGDQLQVNADGVCVCPEGSAPGDGGCVPVADEGGSAAGDGGSGASSPACSAGESCACATSQDCPQGELCDRYGSGRCVPAPQGLGAACSGAADCAGSEATYCEIFSTHTCVVQGCAQQAGVCPGDFVCCDFAIIGTSLCAPADTAPGGNCPAPGQLVPRSSP